MLVLIRRTCGELAAISANLISHIDATIQGNYVYFDDAFESYGYITDEPIESLARRINAARQGNVPALPPGVE